MPFYSNKTEEAIADFCTIQGIHWHFIPERAPHFGGLWEAAVRSFKAHLTRVVGNSKLDFEEMVTVLTACLNSRPLGTLPHNDDDGIEMLTPGHFLIGRPLQAIPDHPNSSQPLTLLRRWYLCQGLVRHFWERWRNEYIIALRSISKWKHPSNNFKIGDIVVVKEESLVSSHWSVARVIKTHTGVDGLIRVVTLKTKDGIYKRLITKIALLLPCQG